MTKKVMEKMIYKKKKKKENKKQGQELNCIESGKTRLTTKIRSILERIFGKIKQFYALDRMRNTSVGHLAIDTKIVGAMLNFTFRPEVYDAPETVKVARRLRDRLEKIPENPIKFLIRYGRLTTEKKF